VCAGAGRSIAAVATALAVALSTVAPSAAATPVDRSAPETGLVFVDIGRQLGLPPSGHSWDLDVGRIDGDRYPDLVISDHTSIHIYVNTHPGLRQVVEIPLGDPHGCAIADVDQNGLGDVYCSRGAYQGTGARPNVLYLQGPAGSFTDVAADYGVADTFGRGRHVAFGDLDHVGGPDLFVGNEPHRSDVHPSRNRIFVSGDGPPMHEWRLGEDARNDGAICAQIVDLDGDGWQDVLVCGGIDQEQHHSLPSGLHLLQSQPAINGRRFVAIELRPRLDTERVRGAYLARLNGDRNLDLVAVTDHLISVLPGRRGGRFGPPAYLRRLTAGTWVTVGQLDGREGTDMFVVQGCTAAGNAADLAFLHRPGFHFAVVRAPRTAGCGDTAATIDLDRDGRDEVIVGNGRWSASGPYQVLSLDPAAG
jgi:hypothetical protein